MNNLRRHFIRCATVVMIMLTLLCTCSCWLNPPSDKEVEKQVQEQVDEPVHWVTKKKYGENSYVYLFEGEDTGVEFEVEVRAYQTGFGGYYIKNHYEEALEEYED